MSLVEKTRVGLRFASILAWSLWIFGLRLCVLPVGWVAPRAQVRCRNAVFRLWGRGVLRLAGMRLERRGVRPEGPAYLVCNHICALDTAVMAAAVGGVFVARHDMADWGLLGFMGRKLDTIFVNRASMRDTVRVNELIARALGAGFTVQVFAESRIGPGDTVRPFKAPLLEPAVQAGIAVHYAAITYRTPPGAPPASQVMHWAEGVTLKQHLTGIFRLPRSEASITFGDKPISAPDRKALAADLHQAVLEIFTPLG